MPLFENLKTAPTAWDGTAFLTRILDHRNYLMGVAIALVLIFHFGCWVYNPVGRLNMGYVGVDIFLFLSGLGLSFSYEKHPPLTFYAHRLKRIYPVYFAAVSLTFLLKDWSLREALNNYLLLGLYTDGGQNRYDWYLESLFTFYLLFPLFFLWSRLRYYALALTFCTIFAVLNAFPAFFDSSWWYDCFLARFPIFLYGIMFRQCRSSFRIVALIGLLLYLPCYVASSRFLAGSLLVLPLIYGALRALPHLPSALRRGLEFCGRHSLELYCANCLLQIVMELYIPVPKYRFLPYWVLQALFSAFFIVCNRWAGRVLR